MDICSDWSPGNDPDTSFLFSGASHRDILLFNSKHIRFPKCWTWSFFEIVCFTQIWRCFQKWLPRPNHSAHMKDIEILFKTAVSMSRDVSSESKSIGTNSKCSSLAWMSTWISRWRRRRQRPNNSAHLARPLGYRVQEPNIPCGESLTSTLMFWCFARGCTWPNLAKAWNFQAPPGLRSWVSCKYVNSARICQPRLKKFWMSVCTCRLQPFLDSKHNCSD